MNAFLVSSSNLIFGYINGFSSRISAPRFSYSPHAHVHWRISSSFPQCSDSNQAIKYARKWYFRIFWTATWLHWKRLLIEKVATWGRYMRLFSTASCSTHWTALNILIIASKIHQKSTTKSIQNNDGSQNLEILLTTPR